MTIDVRRYDASLAGDWARLLSRSRNGVFLFERAYMDYHADRFVDASFIAYAGKEPVALLPASLHASDRLVASHGGLTFGGLVVDRDVRTERAGEIVEAVLAAIATLEVDRLELREVPLMFCTAPSDDVRFAFTRRGFEVSRQDLASVLDLSDPVPPSKSRRRDIARAAKLGVRVERCGIEAIHPLIQQVLGDRHSATPVHTLEELSALSASFPDRIFALCARLDGQVVAGTIIYAYDRVWHTQYLASGPAGRAVSALDAVIAEAIWQAAASKARWFSFGHSMDGDDINSGLLWQKESFGGRGIIFPRLSGPVRPTP